MRSMLAVLLSLGPKGFVTQANGEFHLDGKPFNFVGANSYWLGLLTSTADVDATFKEMQGAGVKVLRTWGFNAINGSEVAGALQSGLTYYQVLLFFFVSSSQLQYNSFLLGWNSSELDYVVNTAGKYGIKLILAFTNNWVELKGMELYINWIAGAGNTHDVFYTNPRSLHLIVNSPNVFAWEMMNEARCLGDLPSGPACVPGTELLTKWYKQQSDFIRSLDPFHLITTGGEGHFYWKNKNVGYWSDGVFTSDYNFNGQAGEDFDTELTLPNVDFGAYDFPGSNWTAKDWGLFWIKAHADSAKKANKPVILEEFGVTGIKNKTEVYTAWVNLALETKHARLMVSKNFPWQFGMLGLKEDGGNRVIKYADALINGASPNDGLLSTKSISVWDIFTNTAKIQASRSG
ncbi:glycoside hydrolase [Pholiota molesta]|nr:glycoside hydrolase [Pholiota molesta]